MINSESKKIWYVAYFSGEEKRKQPEMRIWKSILKFETNTRIQISLKRKKKIQFPIVRNKFLKLFKLSKISKTFKNNYVKLMDTYGAD